MKNKMYNRRAFLKTSSALAAGSLLLPKTGQSARIKKPNILIFSCEDISSYLHCFGDSIARTPNLDQFAAEGIRYTHFFSTLGVCAPSRFALITGMYPSACGGNNMRTNRKNLPEGIPPYEAVPPAEVKCVSELLRANGYYCTNNVKTDYQFKPPVTAWDEHSRSAHWKHRPEGMPFFAIFNTMTTHESQVWDRANDPVTIKPEDVTVPPFYPDTPEIREDIARVYSNTTVMDREFGEMLQEVKKAGLLEETIVIFYSDHGGPLPRGKREIYDSGLRSPMIIRFPNQLLAGAVVDDLVSFVDIPPTLLSLAGIKPPEYMHGRAFLGTYQAKPRDYIFAARDRIDGQYDVRRGVRDHYFKYIRNYNPDIGCYQDVKFRKNLDSMQELLRFKEEDRLNQDQSYWFRETKAPEELYKLDEDPYELHNLAEDPRYEDDLIRLRKVHEAWLKDVGDNPHQTEKELVWSMWPDGMQPVTKNPEIVSKGKMIKITCPTHGASIAYQINGKGLKNGHWFLYTQAFEVRPGDRITAVAHRIGYKSSKKISYQLI